MIQFILLLVAFASAKPRYTYDANSGYHYIDPSEFYNFYTYPQYNYVGDGRSIPNSYDYPNIGHQVPASFHYTPLLYTFSVPEVPEALPSKPLVKSDSLNRPTPLIRTTYAAVANSLESQEAPQLTVKSGNPIPVGSAESPEIISPVRTAMRSGSLMNSNAQVNHFNSAESLEIYSSVNPMIKQAVNSVNPPGVPVVKTFGTSFSVMGDSRESEELLPNIQPVIKTSFRQAKTLPTFSNQGYHLGSLESLERQIPLSKAKFSNPLLKHNTHYNRNANESPETQETFY